MVEEWFDRQSQDTIATHDLFWELIQNVKNLEPISHIIQMTKTFDQARAFLACTEAIANPKIWTTLLLTAGRGRGKSATLGLAAAMAIAYGYGNIVVTAPYPENLNIFFAFLLVGLQILHYEENRHFEIIQDVQSKYIRQIRFFCTHKQSVRFIAPDHLENLQEDIELLIIDEAASIRPFLPTTWWDIEEKTKQMTQGPLVILMSATTSGYEGTGKSFLLKFIKKIKTLIWKKKESSLPPRIFQEMVMDEPIRYAKHDPVEFWLYELLCLHHHLSPSLWFQGCPAVQSCRLFLVDRNALFSEHKIAACFLQKIMHLFHTVHYKNSPDDLQMLCDAPSHRILVLIPPSPAFSIGILPDVLSVVHIAYEGQIARKWMQKQSWVSHSTKVQGDLIPWVISRQYLDASFAELAGVRILRLAVHPDVYHMGYGSRAIQALIRFFQRKMLGKKNTEATLPIEMVTTAHFVSPSEGAFSADSRSHSKFRPHSDLRGISFAPGHHHPHAWWKYGGERKNPSLTPWVGHATLDRTDTTYETLEEKSNRPQIFRSTGWFKKKSIASFQKTDKASFFSSSPILIQLESRQPPLLDYIGVAFGLTHLLFSFWRKNGFRILWLRPEKNQTTDAHTCIMLFGLSRKKEEHRTLPLWLRNYQHQFLDRLILLLNWKFSSIPSMVVFEIFQNIPQDSKNKTIVSTTGVSPDHKLLHLFLSSFGIFNRWDQSQIFAGIQHTLPLDYQTLEELFPRFAKIFLWHPELYASLWVSEWLLLIAIGFQHKSLGVVQKELNLKTEAILFLSRGILTKYAQCSIIG